MPLTGAQSKAFEDALVSAFYRRGLLELMVFHQTDRALNQLVGEGLALSETAAQLVRAAEAGGWLDALVEGAVRENPGNPVLRAFYASVWPALRGPGQSREDLKRQLQTMVVHDEVPQDVDPWIRTFVETGPKVCCIEIKANRGTKVGTIRGTGFLVGKDTIITNYHVMEPVILGERGQETSAGSALGAGYAAKSPDVRFRFDYRVLPDGSSLGTERVHALAGGTLHDWLIDHSPYSGVDLLADPGGASPTIDELDYALMRLATSAGDDPLVHAPGTKRGWLTIPASPPPPVANASLLILQHFEGRPLKVAFHAVTGVNANTTRVTYRVNTEIGSSGSPCFGHKWDLLAIHHSGDPSFGLLATNQGVPMATIAARLARRHMAF